MTYLETIKRQLPKGFGILEKGYIYLPLSHTSLFYNFKRLSKNIKIWGTENRLYVYTTLNKQLLYIIDLKSKEGIKQFYGLQLEKELSLSKQILEIKKATSVALKTALTLKE